MTTLTAKPANFTRRSPSFVARFAREGRFHFIPLYWLLRLSDFAREGMERSASYRFADHLYRGLPSGRGWLGRWLDGFLLQLPAARSMRERCFESRRAMRSAFEAQLATGIPEPFRMLTVPCGLPRDVRDFAADLAPELRERIEYTGLDLDPEVLGAARAFLEGSGVPTAWLLGDALEAASFPAAPPHFIASTGLGEFLDDAQLARFYANVFAALAPGGTFFTSAAAQGTASATLLSAFEIEIHYRTRAAVERVLAGLPWVSVELSHDAIGLQTFVRATKG